MSTSITGKALAEILQTYVTCMNENKETAQVLKEGENCQLRLECLDAIERKIQECEQTHQIQTIIREEEAKCMSRMYSQQQMELLSKDIEELLSRSVLPISTLSLRVVKRKPKP